MNRLITSATRIVAPLNTSHTRVAILTTGVLLALGAVSPAHAEGDASAGRSKAFTCLGCHAAPGYRNAYPAYPVPKLGGQHAEYIVAALKAYRNGERQHPTMRGHTATLSDQDIADIAVYFAGLKPR